MHIMAWNCFKMKKKWTLCPRPNFSNLVTKSFTARSPRWVNQRWRTKSATSEASSRCRSKGLVPLLRLLASPQIKIGTQWKALRFHLTLLLLHKHSESVFLVYSRKTRIFRISLIKNWDLQFVSRILPFQSSLCLNPRNSWRRGLANGVTPQIRMKRYPNLLLWEANSFLIPSTAEVAEGETSTCQGRKISLTTMIK